MSAPELLFETDAPLTGHNTTWTLKHEGQTIDVKLERGTRPVSIDNLDTGHQISTTSKRGTAIVAQVLDAYVARFGDDPTTPKEDTMSDQTTHITPKLALEKDAYGFTEILLDGTAIGEYVYGGNHDENMQEMFRILTSMTYTRRNGTYWADWQGGEDFWTAGISLHDAVEQAAKGIALFLTGQNGYPLFGEKTSLKAVK